MTNSRFIAYAAYKDGALISEGSLPVPEWAVEEAHEIRWVGPDDIKAVE